MIKKEQREQIRKIHQRYSQLHNELSILTNDVSILELKRYNLSRELENIREEEVCLINKIEELTGEPINQSTLLKIINENE